MLFYTFKRYSGCCLKLQKSNYKTFRCKYIKNESFKSYLSNKEQKAMFPLVFWSDAHFSFARLFCASPIERSILLYECDGIKFVQAFYKKFMKRFPQVIVHGIVEIPEK